MTGINTLKKKISFGFGAGGLYEYPLEDEGFDLEISKDKGTLRIHNKLINEFNNVEVTFIIKDFWGSEFYIELEKEVVHNGNDDIISFDRDFTQAILKNNKIKSIWFKLEFNQPTLYIFLKKMNNHVQSGGVVF